MKRSTIRVETTDYRPSLWLWLPGVLSLLAIVAALVLTFTLPSPWWQRASSVALTVICALGIVEIGRRRLRLAPEGLYFVSNFRSKFVPRSDIDSVTWEAGVGVSLRLANGAWVDVPDALVGDPTVRMAFSARAVLQVVLRAGLAEKARVSLVEGDATAISVSAAARGGAAGYHPSDPNWKENPASEWGLGFVAQQYGSTLVISSRNEIVYIVRRQYAT